MGPCSAKPGPGRTGQSSIGHYTGKQLFRPFGQVRNGEGITVFLLALIGFLLLTSYYILKVVREPLIIADGGAELKRYSSAIQALLLVGAVRLYDVLAARLNSMKLISLIHLFFISNLLIFFGLSQLSVPLGVPFFLWVGIFNVTVIAQFWAFTNDIYTNEQGQRLFAIVGVGGSLGAVAGADIAGWLFKPLGPYLLLLLAAAILLVCLLLNWVVYWRVSRASNPIPPTEGEDPIGNGSTFKLLIQDRYLLLIGALTLMLSWVGSMGDYILDRTLLDAAQAAAMGQANSHYLIEQYIGSFRAHFFTWVNIASLILQAFFVSRLIRYWGVGAALYIMLLVALASYASMAVLPVLAVIAIGKAAESGVSYSLGNTARHALFLITPREAKYKAQTFIDTFFWRAGDVFAAAMVGLGSALLMTRVHFIWITLGLILLWLVVVIALSRLYRQRANPDRIGEARWETP